MTEHTGLHDNLKAGLCPKCAATVSKLENIMANMQIKKLLTRNSMII